MAIFLIVLFVLGAVALSGVRIMREYERAVVFRLGRAQRQLAGPGVVFLLPLGIDRARVIDTRTKVVQIPPQEVITHDNISIVVDAVVYITVESPSHAVLEVEQYMPATLQLAATTMRAVIGRMDLDDILAHRDQVNDEVRTSLDSRTEQWGVEISAVELRDITLPQEMKRALARQAEAERERRAKIIAAEGEAQAAVRLADAARIIAESPGAMQLRLYQTMIEVSNEPATKIVLPIPIELLQSSGAPAGLSREQVGSVVQGILAAVGGSSGAGQLAPSSGQEPRGVLHGGAGVSEAGALGAGAPGAGALGTGIPAGVDRASRPDAKQPAEPKPGESKT